MPVSYPEILLDLGEKLATQLEGCGLSPERASEEAWRLTEFIRDQWGGMDIYIPKGHFLELDTRYSRIYEVWHAEGFHPGLCHQFGISMNRLRQIVKAMRLSRRQPTSNPPLPFDN